MKIVKIMFLLFCFFGMQYSVAAEKFPTSTPIGLWKTIDDVTGQTKSIVQISAEHSGKLSGTVVRVFKDPDKRCIKCEGAKHNQLILGMEVMYGFVPSKDNKGEWVDGTILDPKNGKTYHSSIRLIEKGHKLVVRGFIGLPLFGRSQTWERVEG
jgi:uncharacterized protein (DUF2147 family)